MKHVGEAIRNLRQERALGLKALARRVGVDPAHISRIESGKTPPSARLLKEISRALKADLELLRIAAGDLPEDVYAAFRERPFEACLLIREAFPQYSAKKRSEKSARARSRLAPRPRKTYSLLDLFAGAGGFTLGFVQTGRFKPLWANDNNRFAAETYRANFGEECSLSDIDDVLASKRELPSSCDVVIGGPPCQGFSLLNKQRNRDCRKDLWRAYMEVVRRLRPFAFVMENVPELLRSLEYRELEKIARRLGYAVASGILNAADYGVPQRRKRAIVLATRIGTPYLPSPTHWRPMDGKDLFQDGLLPWETVRRAVADLPAPEGTELAIGMKEPPVDLHFGRNPTPKSIKRYKCIPEGGNRFDLQRKRPDLTPDCWIRKKSGGTDLFGRLWWDQPAFTIRTEFFKPEKGRYLHPEHHRPITHREAARLQSFPDDFRFCGTKIEIARQIGNAVPPLLARRIAEALLGIIDGSAYLMPQPC